MAWVIVALQQAQQRLPGTVFKVVLQDKWFARGHELFRTVIHGVHGGQAQTDLFLSGAKAQAVKKQLLDAVLGNPGQVQGTGNRRGQGALPGRGNTCHPNAVHAAGLPSFLATKKTAPAMDGRGAVWL